MCDPKRVFVCERLIICVCLCALCSDKPTPVPSIAGVSEYARRSYLFDTTSQRFFVCLYSDDRSANTCLLTFTNSQHLVLVNFISFLCVCLA